MQVLDYAALRAKGITYSKITLWRYIRLGRFPAPIKLGEMKSAWVESEVDEWLKSRINEREREAQLSLEEREAAKFAFQKRFKKDSAARKTKRCTNESA
jgi:prophage regulatory protein